MLGRHAFGLVLAVGLGAALAGGCGTPTTDAGCSGTLVATSRGPVADPALTEVSGLVASATTPGVIWVHNDSGDSARVFALGADGATRGTYTLAGAAAVDWEDIARGPGPVTNRSYLYLADIGDNAMSRPQITVYRVPEPTVDGASGAATLGGVDALRLRYPDGAYDAEALLVDPSSGELLVIVKHLGGGAAGVYRAPAGLAAGSLTTLTKVADVALGAGLANAVTAADVAPDGGQVALRTYGSVLLWRRAPDKPVWKAFAAAPCRGPVPSEVQGEAIGFDRDGRGYVTVSEGAHPTLHHFTAP